MSFAYLHLPASLCSTGVTRLPRSYGRSDSCRPALRALSRAMNTVPISGRYPCFTLLKLPAIPSPTTCCRPRTSGPGFVSSAYRRRGHSARPRPAGPCVTWASPFPGRLATTTGRIEFVILRTSHSPPVALHVRLAATQLRSVTKFRPQTLTGTRTPPIQQAHRRTSSLSARN
jgi:hypothetical protein